MKKGLIGPIAAAIVATTAAASAGDASTGQHQHGSTTTTTTSTGPVSAPVTTTAAPVTTGTTPIVPTPSTQPTEERDTVTLSQSYRPNRPLLITGGAIFVGTYATTAAIAAAEDRNKDLYLPVVGPWLHLADLPDDTDTLETVLTAGSGVLQGVGVLMTAASFFIPEKVPAATIQAGNFKMNVAPTAFGRASGGIGATGTF